MTFLRFLWDVEELASDRLRRNLRQFPWLWAVQNGWNAAKHTVCSRPVKEEELLYQGLGRIWVKTSRGGEELVLTTLTGDETLAQAAFRSLDYRGRVEGLVYTDAHQEIQVPSLFNVLGDQSRKARLHELVQQALDLYDLPPVK